MVPKNQRSSRPWLPGFLRIQPAKFFTALIAFALGWAGHMGAGILEQRVALTAAAAPAGERQMPVATDTVQSRTIENQFSTHAFLQPKKEVTLHPNANVAVREVRVEVGQNVIKGQVLAYMDSEAQALRSELDRIELKMRDLDFNITVALAKKSFLSKQEYAQKELEHRASSIRKRLAEIEAAGALISPISGVISEVSLKTGDYIDNPAQYFIKIADASAYRLQLYLPQATATQLKRGQDAVLSRAGINDSATDSVEKAMGHITTVSPVVDPKTGSILTEIDLLKIPHGWISGMYVEVTLSIEKAEHVISVPNEALVYDKNQAFIYRVVAAAADTSPRGLASAEPAASSRVQKVLVQLGLRDGKYSQIKTGLEEFDMIVVEGQGNLADGAPVQVIR